jgi:hypothetical protein
LILAGCLTCLCHGVAFAQGEWEFLGPDVGYRPEAFFVSQHAIYLGLAEEEDTGLGLYRYRFDQGEWELFAWEGYRIMGVTVWGESDENILLIRYGGDTDILRSTMGCGGLRRLRRTRHEFWFIVPQSTQTLEDGLGIPPVDLPGVEPTICALTLQMLWSRIR